MTQESYNIIVKVLQSGVPALANELISHINNLINENQTLKQELKNKEEISEAKEEEN